MLIISFNPFDHEYDDVDVDGDVYDYDDDVQDGGFLCPSEIKYAKPKRGKTAQVNFIIVIVIIIVIITIIIFREPGKTLSTLPTTHKP